MSMSDTVSRQRRSEPARAARATAGEARRCARAAEVLAQPLERARAVLVGADLELVLPFYLEQRADLAQRAGDGEAIEHAASVASRADCMREGRHGTRGA